MLRALKRRIKAAIYGTPPEAVPENDPRPVRDLQQIADLTIPPNQTFDETRDAACKIEGMFSIFSMALMDCLLSFQKEIVAKGNILELGVFKGRSASLLGRHLSGTDRLVLVDVAEYLNRNAIADFADAVDFVLTPTEQLRETLPDYPTKRDSFRFIHIDASHAYRATFNELQMADELLGAKGIIALDDYTNLNYSQNIVAIIKYLCTTETQLTIFLVTNEKAYLCNKADLEIYSDFVLDRLLSEMGSRGEKECVLARTDIDPEYRAFFIRRRTPGEEGHFYGLDIYHNQILG